MSPPSFTVGRQGRSTHVVSEQDTAIALGSGDLAVLGTPRLVAWLEAATCAAVAGTLEPGETTVGTRVTAEHLRASPQGAEVTATATLQYVDGRLLRFDVVAQESDGTVVGHGEVTRVRVDAARFLARIGRPPSG